MPDVDQRSTLQVAPIVSASLPHAMLSPTAALLYKPVFILFLFGWVVNLVFLLLHLDPDNGGRWIEAAFLLSCVATSLLGLARRLPLQNVLMAGMLIACISCGIVAVGIISRVPFGPILYGHRFGEKIFEVVPWPVPFLWVVLIINGRGVARLIMRPWRKTNFYGFWVIGLACALAATFDLGFEPFGVYLKDWWIWETRNSILSWYKAPWVNFLGWFITALAVLVFTIPWLINKRPIKQPMDYHPLVVWLLLNFGLAAVNAANGLWAAAIVGIIVNGIVGVYAVRGARW